MFMIRNVLYVISTSIGARASLGIIRARFIQRCLAMYGADKHAMANACKLMCNATCDELGTASWSGSLPLKPPAQARECCYRSCCTTHYPVPDGPYLKTYVNLILAPAGARIKLT